MTETCMICLDELNQSKDFITLPDCHHQLHASCFLKWFDKSIRCPYCRTKVPGNMTARTNKNYSYRLMEEITTDTVDCTVRFLKDVCVNEKKIPYALFGSIIVVSLSKSETLNAICFSFMAGLITYQYLRHTEIREVVVRKLTSLRSQINSIYVTREEEIEL